MAALGKSQISEPLIAKQNWRDIAVFIERAFPQGTRVWMGDKLAAFAMESCVAEHARAGESR